MVLKVLYLVRGIPGAGKSTFAKTLANTDGYRVEADSYHINGDGVYDWKPENVHLAHRWCFDITENWLKQGKAKVIVSNTFTTEKELKPYVDLAAQYAYRVVTLIVENRHGGVNIHDVPQETLDKMRARFSIKL